MTTVGEPMATDSKPLSNLAKQTYALFQQNVNVAGQALAQSVLEDMGLQAADGWQLDFATGTAHRTLPDAVSTDAAAVEVSE